MSMKNAIFFTREFAGHTIYINAWRLEALELWGLQVKEDGQIVDMRKSDDPWKDAQGIIEERMAHLNNGRSMDVV